MAADWRRCRADGHSSRRPRHRRRPPPTGRQPHVDVDTRFRRPVRGTRRHPFTPAAPGVGHAAGIVRTGGRSRRPVRSGPAGGWRGAQLRFSSPGPAAGDNRGSHERRPAGEMSKEWMRGFSVQRHVLPDRGTTMRETTYAFHIILSKPSATKDWQQQSRNMLRFFFLQMLQHIRPNQMAML